jgi:hypothetical protein
LKETQLPHLREAMSVVLKIKCNTELYRVVLDGDKITFDVIQEAIRGIMPKTSFVVKYLDEEDDLCTLCPDTFKDFVCQAKEHNGKNIMKVEAFEHAEVQSDCAPSLGAPAWKDHMNHLAFRMQRGVEVLKRLPQRGFHHFWHGHHHGDSHGHVHAIKSLKFTLAQLHKNGLLNATSMAALILNSLPQIMLLLIEDSEKVNWKLTHKLPKMQRFLQDLQTLVSSTEGMEQCATFVEDWREQKIAPSEACLQLLPALSLLPFDSKVQFLETIYRKIEDSLQGKHQKIENKFYFMPTVCMIHDGVTCDGCEVSPIQGLRFKCKSRANYDLCATCYTRKDSGDCSAEEFETISFPSCHGFEHMMSTFKGCGKGKGKGKCKGKGKGYCKGKGKGKGKWCGNEDLQDESQPARACARKGCTYAATWHAPHCCGGCAHMGMHGGHCDRQVFVKRTEIAEDNAEGKQENSDFEMVQSIELPCNAVGDDKDAEQGC